MRVEIDYSDESALIANLRGQQFLIITLPATAVEKVHGIIVRAAGAAGVPYIMPNVYGYDPTNPSLLKDDVFTQGGAALCAQVEAAGAAYVAMVCGFWYQWSLALGEPWFGFDIAARQVTLFDGGLTHINASTWSQCGRALAAFLSQPEAVVAEWKNKPLYVSSFRVNQRNMLDSLNSVLGTSDVDWNITHEAAEKRLKDGLQLLQQGVMNPKALYARIFLPAGDGDYESSGLLVNDRFGLPKENLDEATKEAVEMVKSGWKAH